MSTDTARQPVAELLSPAEASSSFEAWPAAKRALLERYAVDMTPAAGDDAPTPGTPEPDAETLAAIETLREKARAEGFEQGLAEGRARAKVELSEQRGRLEGLAQQLEKPLSELDARVEEQLIELTLEIGATLFRAQIQHAPEQVREIVREAVQMLPVATNDIAVYLHPDDAALLANDASAQAPWQLVEDANMTRGGCRVTTTASDVDATVAGRLQALGEALLGGSV